MTEYARDFWLFLRYNNFSPFEGRDRRLSYRTIIEAHTIEKGLALPKPRAYFGQEKIKSLLDINSGWTPSSNDMSRSMLLGALRDYRSKFANLAPPDPVLFEMLDKFLEADAVKNAQGGVHQVVDCPAASSESTVDFLSGRFSARNFAPNPLSDDEIIRVVNLAQRAPSQCNRQSVRVHAYREKTKIERLLNLQGGARGFIEAVPTLFVVTSEITAWGGPQQRNQPYVDGGIFTMMLLLALKANGFVSCPLNLAVSHRTEKMIKNDGDIPIRERLIVMVAAGHPPEGALYAANSPRRKAGEILNLHDRISE